MTRSLRVAVVGAGRMGRHHARIYASLTGCELVAVVDPDRQRADDLSTEFGGRACGSLDEVDTDLHAASVAVPTVKHEEIGLQLMERGVAVLVEKPLAPDAAAARRLLEASRRLGCLLQVGHSERFNPVVQAMLRMELAPRFIETQRISPFTFRSADIGVVFDMMIHDIDLVLHLVKRHTCTVDAVGVGVLGSHEDVANARIRFEGGEVVNLTASRLALKTERKIRLFAPSGYVSMDFQKKSGVAIKLADNLDLIRMAREHDYADLSQMQNLDFGSMVRIEPLQITDVEPLRAQIEAFVDSCRNSKAAAVSAEEGCAAVELAERIVQSVRSQGWDGQLAADV